MKTNNVRTSARLNRSHVRLALVTALCVATFVACGGSDDSLSGLSCGSGTHEEGGACVSDGPAGAGGASAGGAGTSGAAGQSAGAAGTGGASGATAGGAGGGAGGAVTGGGGSGGGSAGGSAGSSAGGSAGGSAGASGSGAAGWGNPHPGDDPCPPKIDINCSDSCGPMHPLCKDPKATCVDAPSGVLPSPIEMPFDPFKPSQTLVLRLPSHPGVDPLCPTSCTKENPAYGLSVSISAKVVTASNTSRFFKVSVADDTWRMSMVPGQPYCHPVGWVLCEAFEMSPSFPKAEAVFFTVPTAAAPARNVVFELSKQKLSCP